MIEINICHGSLLFMAPHHALHRHTREAEIVLTLGTLAPELVSLSLMTRPTIVSTRAASSSLAVKLTPEPAQLIETITNSIEVHAVPQRME